MWRVLYYFPKFFKNQYIKPENLKKFQEKRLRYMVNFAYRHVKVYKEKFKNASIIPSDITTLDDLHKIPIITKDEIKVNYPAGSVTPGYTEQNCIIEHTSGTTGNMLKILYDPISYSCLTAGTYRDHFAQGVRPWHKFCIMCRDPEEFEGATESLMRTCGILEGRPEEELVEQLRIHNPDIIGAHPSLVASMAKVIEDKGIKDITPQFILVGGEVAHLPVRQYIEKVFSCPTLNKYGAYEAFSMAWECKHRNMHISADSVILEFLKDGEPVAPGERGEIVVTNLWNEAMPFIRYRLEDMGIPSDGTCECGRSFPLVEEIEGKFDDFIVLPSGKLVPSTRVIPFFFIVPKIGEFKMIQDKRTHVICRIVPLKGFTDAMEKALIQKIEAVLGESVGVDVEKVTHIDHTGTGKFKRVQRLFTADLLFEGK
jgi:phenylacetate-CoA ligase